MHTRTQTHTSGRQLKIKFLDVLDYSDDSDTNISKFFFYENSFLTEEIKGRVVIKDIRVYLKLL